MWNDDDAKGEYRVLKTHETLTSRYPLNAQKTSTQVQILAINAHLNVRVL
jgi:hypothetical protein